MHVNTFSTQGSTIKLTIKWKPILVLALAGGAHQQCCWEHAPGQLGKEDSSAQKKKSGSGHKAFSPGFPLQWNQPKGQRFIKGVALTPSVPPLTSKECNEDAQLAENTVFLLQLVFCWSSFPHGLTSWSDGVSWSTGNAMGSTQGQGDRPVPAAPAS